MLILPLLLVSAETPPAVPDFDRASTLAQCTASNDDDLDGRLDCLEEHIAGYELFSIVWSEDTPAQRALYQECYNDSTDHDGSDWSDIAFCLDDKVEPKLEVKDSNNGFNIDTAKTACRADYQRRKDTVYPMEVVRFMTKKTVLQNMPWVIGWSGWHGYATQKWAMPRC